MIRDLSDTHDNIGEMRKRIRQQGDEMNKKIDQHYDGVIQKLMEQKEQLKQQVHDTVSQKVKAVTTQLEEVEYAQAEVLSMKELNDTVEKSSDQEILSIKKQVIDRIQQITDKYRKVNLPPVQQATMEFVPTKEAFPQFGFVCSIAKPDPQNCVADPPMYSVKGKKTKFTIITKDNNGNRCSRGGCQVSVQLGGVNDTVQVRDNNDGSYMASFIPQQVGEVKLSVFVNGEQIKGSPYSVMVRDYRSVNKPSKIVDNEGQPWGIAFGKNGMWAVADTYNDCVYIFDGEDQLVRKFGNYGSGSGRFKHPQGVATDNDNHLYVADCVNHRIQKFTIDGVYLLQFGSDGSANGKLKCPNGLTVHNGKIYVSDRDNKRISVFQTDGIFLHNIGSGQLGDPYDVLIAVNGNNQLLVADWNHHCIYTFTLDGDYVGKLGTYGTAPGQLSSPHGIAVDLYGFILVADTDNHRISIFDKDGNYINSFGSKGSAIGQFQYPRGIAVSPNGNIYVSDHDNNRIQIF